MPRIARIVLPGIPHHITQRGNNRQKVFFNDDDRRTYLRFLSEQARRFGLDILGYCLMTNHIHLIATPLSESSLAYALGRAHNRYTLHINRIHQRSGHLWQNRFFSCALDEAHCYQALRYIELNPLRAGIAREASAYRWSSAAAHSGESDESGLLDLVSWRQRWDTRTWKVELQRGQDAGIERAVRASTKTGRPLGSTLFLDRMEAALGFKVRAMPKGRPKKGDGLS